jgi:predicted PurR-regulated permease PerM
VVKTTVNVLLGLVCFGVMWAIGIEFADFWAILIGLLNYVPYIGSIIGVVFPVLISLAQFGSVAFAIVTLLSLTTVQIVVAGFLEPRMMGRAFNLSPLVILIALSFWTLIWGLPGAILAIPMTSVLLIILAEIPSTRSIAVLLSADGRV